MASFDIINANLINTQKSLWYFEDTYRLPSTDSLQNYSDEEQSNLSLNKNTYIGSSYLFGSEYTGPGGVENKDQFDDKTGIFTANLSGTYVVTYRFKLNTIGYINFVAKDINGNRLSSSHKLGYYLPPHNSGLTRDTKHVSGSTTLYLEKGASFGFECMDAYSKIEIEEKFEWNTTFRVSMSGITVLRL